MGLWKPNETIGKGEHIGRRLYQRRSLVGAGDQTRPSKVFELYHFEETRDRDVSLDRLGKTSVDGRVRAYLDPRGRLAATRMSKRTFQGWAVTKSQDLQNPTKGEKLNLIASPIPAQQGEDLSDNDYHAHVVMPDNYDSYVMALHLKSIFEGNFHFEPALELKDNRSLWQRTKAWAGGFFRGGPTFTSL